jgi:hypothetical protein
MAHQICNAPVGPDFYAASASEGLVLVELFGGICAGLQMALSSGLTIRQYVYSDISPQAQLAAAFRMTNLSL